MRNTEILHARSIDEGVTMEAYDAICAASSEAGISLMDASRAMGKRDDYISNKRNSSIDIGSYAGIMAALGYAVVAVPLDAVPAGALVVDPGDGCQRDNAAALEALADGVKRGRAMRQALESGTIKESQAVAALAADPNRRGEFVPVASRRKDPTA